jgi:hypothetical protein
MLPHHPTTAARKVHGKAMSDDAHSSPSHQSLQLVVKLMGSGFIHYFSSGANIFDCVVTVSGKLAMQPHVRVTEMNIWMRPTHGSITPTSCAMAHLPLLCPTWDLPCIPLLVSTVGLCLGVCFRAVSSQWPFWFNTVSPPSLSPPTSVSVSQLVALLAAHHCHPHAVSHLSGVPHPAATAVPVH